MCQRSAANGLVASSAAAPADLSYVKEVVDHLSLPLLATCANNAHNSPVVTSSRKLAISSLRITVTCLVGWLSVGKTAKSV
jgi:hypothetical protein